MFITVSYFFFCSKAFSQLIFSVLKFLSKLWTKRRKLNSLFTLKCISGFKFGITCVNLALNNPAQNTQAKATQAKGLPF